MTPKTRRQLRDIRDGILAFISLALVFSVIAIVPAGILGFLLKMLWRMFMLGWSFGTWVFGG